MRGSLSPLELLHPDGVAARALVLGDACPESLLPAGASHSGERHDLVVVAPSRSELRTQGWLERAAGSAADGLATDGLVYVLVPRRWRRTALRACSRRGLSPEASLAHLPDWSASRHLVPLAPVPASYAFSSLIPIRPSRRRLALALLGRPGGPSLVMHSFSAAGIALRLPGARPLFEWLFRLDGTEISNAPAVITAGGGARGGSFVLHRFADGEERPTAIAKVRTTSPAQTAPPAEAVILERQAAATRAAGAAAPEPLVVESADGRSLMLETALPGRSAAVVLAETPDRLVDVLERLAQWLLAWNRSSVVVRALTEARLDEEVLAPARLLAPLIPDGDAYVSRLEALATEVAGTAFPLVATHNDLTMSNLLVTETGPLGVVDWEAAHDGGLPLVDFLYGAADAAAAARRYEDRVQAFVDCFAPEGRHARALRPLEARLAHALDLSPRQVEICFHACWLHHAANEHRAANPGAERPFLEIVLWAASHRGSGT